MSITGVVVGDRECQLTDELGNVYNMMLDDPDDWRSEVELETEAMRRFAEISQSRRRPLLGPSPG